MVLFLVAAVLHPTWYLRLAFTALVSLLLVGAAALMATRIRRPSRRAWVDWVALGTAGLSLWWLFWIPHLLLPFSLQVLCRTLGISLSLITAVALHRTLPHRLRRLGTLFPLAPIALSFLLPLGPVRWDTGPLSPSGLGFAGELLVVRAEEGPVVIYEFPREDSAVAVGFSSYQEWGFPNFALGDARPGPYSLHREWALPIAALETGGRVEMGILYPTRVVDRHIYSVQTASELLAVVLASGHNFAVIYRDAELKVWAQPVDTHGMPSAAPIRLPGQPLTLVASQDGSMVAYVDGDLRSVWVVDLTTGDAIRLELSEQLAAAGGDEVHIHSLAIAPDGNEIALGLSWTEGLECPGLVWLVDLEGQVLARTLPPTREELEHEPFVSILRYSHDGKRLVAEICCFPSRLSMIDVRSGRVRNLPLGGRGYRDAAFSPDGRYLVATGYDGIYMWRLARF